MNTIVEDLLSVVKSKVAIIIFGVAKSVIIARYLGPELNGVLAGLLVYPSLFLAFGTLGIRKSAAFHLGGKIFTESEIKVSIAQIWLLSTIVNVIVVYLLIYYFTSVWDSQYLIMLAVAQLPFAMINNYISGLYLGKSDIKGDSRIQWIPALFMLISTFIFVILLNLSVKGALLAEISGPMVMSYFLIKRNNIIKELSLKLYPRVIKGLLVLGIGYASALLVTNLNIRINIILLERLSSTFEMGIYSKGAGLAQYLWQIPMLLSTIVFSRATLAKDKGTFSLKVILLLRLSILVITLGSIFILIFSKSIILLLFGNDFLPSSYVLMVLLPGVVSLTVYKVLNMDISGRGRPMIAFYSFLPALFFNIVLCYFLIPKYGALGSSISSTISFTIASAIFLGAYSYITKIPVRKIFGYSRNDFTVLKSIILRK